MIKKYKLLFLASTALIAVISGRLVYAETYKTTTITKQTEIANATPVDFSAFDLNQDSRLSMAEVGEKLFKVFDTDGNSIIDNIEFKNKKIITIVPMEKKTLTFVDYDSDGKDDEGHYTLETFSQKSQLSRFDKNNNGLSPAEFINVGFLELDDNNSKVIEIDEWKEAYTKMLHYPNAEQERYN